MVFACLFSLHIHLLQVCLVCTIVEPFLFLFHSHSYSTWSGFIMLKQNLLMSVLLSLCIGRSWFLSGFMHASSYLLCIDVSLVLSFLEMLVSIIILKLTFLLTFLLPILLKTYARRALKEYLQVAQAFGLANFWKKTINFKLTPNLILMEKLRSCLRWEQGNMASPLLSCWGLEILQSSGLEVIRSL